MNCLKQEHIKVKNKNIRLLRKIDLINEQKGISVLKKTNSTSGKQDETRHESGECVLS